MRAYCDQDRIEALAAQIGNREVASGGMIELQRNVAGGENLAHLRFHHVARQTVFRECRDRAFRPPRERLQKS